MSLVLPFPPSLNRMYRTVNGRFLTSEVGRAYKEECGWSARIQGCTPHTGLLTVTVYLYRPSRRGDADNYTKVLLDSLQGIAWLNDNQIEELHIYRRLDPKNPRVELTIERCLE